MAGVRGFGGWGKIFESLFEGSMVGSGPTVFAVWSYVIAKTQAPGLVELNPKLLAGVIGGEVEKIREAIEFLSSPDPDSRGIEHEGRRLVHQHAFQYFVPQWEFYRAKRDAEAKNEYMRNYMAERRAKEKGGPAQSTAGQESGRQSRQTDDNGTRPVPASKSTAGTSSVPEGSGAKPAAAPHRPKAESTLPATKAKPNGQGEPTAGALVWEAYVTAYRMRWGVAPARNAAANSFCSRFSKSMPEAEAPDVIAFYLRSPRGLYVSAKHPLNLAVRDAQALRTEWLTGRHGTDGAARQGDQSATRFEAFRPMLDEADRKEGQ